jgi:hypothetical protein
LDDVLEFDPRGCGAQNRRMRQLADPLCSKEEGMVAKGRPKMSEPQYEVLEADDGTFTVEIYGRDGADAVVTQFSSREEAVEWVREQRRKLGADKRYQ